MTVVPRGPRHQVVGRLRALAHGAPVGQGPEAVRVRGHVAFGTQVGVAALQFGHQSGCCRTHIGGHCVVRRHPRPMGADPDQTGRITGVPLVEDPHPPDEREDLLGTGERLGGLQQSHGVPGPGADMGVEPGDERPVLVEGDGPEARLTDQQPGHARLEREDLVRATRPGTAADHRPFTDHPEQGPQIVQRRRRVHGAQRVGRPPDPLPNRGMLFR